MVNLQDLNNFIDGDVFRGAKILHKNIPNLKYLIDNEINVVNFPADEIVHKVPLIYIIYYNNNEESTKLFNKDGYFRTEEIGRLFLNLGNRLKILD